MFRTFEYIPRNGITGSYYESISSCLGNPSTVFQSVCAALHFHQQCVDVFLFLASLFVFAVVLVFKHAGCGNVPSCDFDVRFLDG